MDQNFHYHVTYTAAVSAGFSLDDAVAIARAARYVDECDGVTVQSTGTLIIQNLLDTIPGYCPPIQELLKIWPVFHFLPGNFNNICSYVDPQAFSRGKPHLHLAPELICGSESSLTAQVVEGAKDCFGNTQIQAAARLQRVGIAMHVLADTFAHQGFAGIPLSSINEVRKVSCAWKGEDLSEKTFAPFQYSPALTSGSFGYLGHGRIGHLPDQPGIAFLYQAAWKNPARGNRIYRYNPLEFYCAYLQMEEAMEFIRGKRSSFSNYVDRGHLLNRWDGLWPVTLRFLTVLEDARTDENLPNTWYSALDGIQRPPEYIRYDSHNEAALIQSFIAAARDHQALVMAQSIPLKNYLNLFSN